MHIDTCGDSVEARIALDDFKSQGVAFAVALHECVLRAPQRGVERETPQSFAVGFAPSRSGRNRRGEGGADYRREAERRPSRAARARTGGALAPRLGVATAGPRDSAWPGLRRPQTRAR